MSKQMQGCRECNELTEHRLTCVLNRSANLRCLVQDTDRAASAAVPAYRIRELESALQQIKDMTEGSRCVDCEAVHVVASDAMSYVPARAASAPGNVADEIPTSWLDPLLTGPNAVIGTPPYSGTDIERLLRAVKERVAVALHTPRKDEPDIFADALASQIDAIRRAAFDECIAIVPEVEQRIMEAKPGEKLRDIIEAELVAARDKTQKLRSDKSRHHHVAGVLQEDVDEAEN